MLALTLLTTGCAALPAADKKTSPPAPTADSPSDADGKPAAKSSGSWWDKLCGLRDPNSVQVRREKRHAEISDHFQASRDAAEFKIATTRLEEGNTQGCIEVLLPLLQRHPESREAQLLLAEAYLAENHTAEARKQVEIVLKKHPRDPHVQYMMGLVQDAEGNPHDAAEHYGQALQLEPGSEVYAVSYETATRHADTAAGKPHALDSAAAKAEGKSAENTRAADSADSADAAVGNASSAKDAANEHLAAAETALRAANVRGATHEIGEAQRSDAKDPQIVISAGVLALRYNYTELAVHVLTEGTKKFPRSAALYRTLGTAHYRRKEYPAAQTALQQALSLDKSCALSYFLLGCTLAKQGQPEAADEQFRLAQAHDPRYVAPH